MDELCAVCASHNAARKHAESCSVLIASVLARCQQCREELSYWVVTAHTASTVGVTLTSHNVTFLLV